MDDSPPVRGGRHLSLSISGVLLGVGYWLFETLVHVFIFREGTFLHELFPPEPNELWMRSVVFACFAGFGFYATRVGYRIRKFEREIRAQKIVEGSLTDIVGQFVPICAHCKDIRNPDESWTSIEGYFRERSEVKFSHGLCPRCVTELYPEFAAKRTAAATTARPDERAPGGAAIGG